MFVFETSWWFILFHFIWKFISYDSPVSLRFLFKDHDKIFTLLRANIQSTNFTKIEMATQDNRGSIKNVNNYKENYYVLKMAISKVYREHVFMYFWFRRTFS